MREELDDVGGGGYRRGVGGAAPCLVETAFLNLPGLARDTKLITIGSEHDPNDGDRLLALSAGLTRTVPCTS